MLGWAAPRSSLIFVYVFVVVTHQDTWRVGAVDGDWSYEQVTELMRKVREDWSLLVVLLYTQSTYTISRFASRRSNYCDTVNSSYRSDVLNRFFIVFSSMLHYFCSFILTRPFRHGSLLTFWRFTNLIISIIYTVAGTPHTDLLTHTDLTYYGILHVS